MSRLSDMLFNADAEATEATDVEAADVEAADVEAADARDDANGADGANALLAERLPAISADTMEAVIFMVGI